MKKILFVCTGNTCRSPMAHGFLKNALESDTSLVKAYMADSAGIYATEGDPASHPSIKALNNWGIDLSSHRARRISPNDIHSSDLILTMTSSHKDTLSALYPEASKKIFTLKEFAEGIQTAGPGGPDIGDPYGMPEEIYLRCANDIKQAVEKLVSKLKGSIERE
jgi:protein-tyrosine phosphatase